MTQPAADREQRKLKPHAVARIGLFFAGLLAGDFFLYLSINAMSLHGYWQRNRAHPGTGLFSASNLAGQWLADLEIFLIMAMISAGGWLVVGPLAAVLLKTRTICRYHPLNGIIFGAFLGPLGLFPVLVILAKKPHEALGVTSLDNSLWLFAPAVVVGAPAGFVYFLLVRLVARRSI